MGRYTSYGLFLVAAAGGVVVPREYRPTTTGTLLTPDITFVLFRIYPCAARNTKKSLRVRLIPGIRNFVLSMVSPR